MLDVYSIHYAGLSSLGVPGVPWHTQILADQLTLFQPGGQIIPTLILLAHPDFQTFRRPCHPTLETNHPTIKRFFFNFTMLKFIREFYNITACSLFTYGNHL